MKAQMKRRSFLGLFGASIAAPALPAMGGGAAGAAYSRSAYGLAVMHAKTRHHVSARGIAHCLKVTLPQAKAMISEMASSGLVKPIAGGAGVHVRAISNVLQPGLVGLRTADLDTSNTVRQRRTEMPKDSRTPAPKGTGMNAMVGHLHHLCVANGHTLHPRCANHYGVAL